MSDTMGFVKQARAQSFAQPTSFRISRKSNRKSNKSEGKRIPAFLTSHKKSAPHTRRGRTQANHKKRDRVTQYPSNKRKTTNPNRNDNRSARRHPREGTPEYEDVLIPEHSSCVCASDWNKVPAPRWMEHSKYVPGTCTNMGEHKCTVSYEKSTCRSRRPQETGPSRAGVA